MRTIFYLSIISLIIVSPPIDLLAEDISTSIIEGIKIEGNKKVKEQIIRRELRFKEGETFDTGKIKRSKERIYNLGLFKEVEINTTPATSKDKVDVIIKVEERASRSVVLWPLIVDDAGGSLAISETNLRGENQAFIAAITPIFGEKKKAYRLNFTNPYLFDREIFFSFDFFDTGGFVSKGEIEGDKYEYNRIKRNQLILGRPLTEDSNLYLLYRLEKGRYEFLSKEHLYEISKSKEEDVVTRSLSLVLNRDNRDNIFNPSSGSLIGLLVEYGSGDVKFNKFISEGSLYFKCRRNSVLSFHSKVGRVKGRDDLRIPPNERFKVGGIEWESGLLLRGYVDGEITEEGVKLFILNTDYKIPFGRKWKGIVFADGGYGWTEKEEMNLNDLKYTVGLGIYFETNMSRCWFEYGYALNPGNIKSNSAVHFRIYWPLHYPSIGFNQYIWGR